MCDNLLTIKFLKFSSYHKWIITFEGKYEEKQYYVDLNVNNDNISNLCLNNKISIENLCEHGFIKIKSYEIKNDSAVIDEDNGLELRDDMFVPILLDYGHITFGSTNEEITKYLEYKSDLDSRYYSVDEINDFQ